MNIKSCLHSLSFSSTTFMCVCAYVCKYVCVFVRGLEL